MMRNRLTRKNLTCLAALAAALTLSGCLERSGGTPMKLATQVDMRRIYGGWFIIATIPNWFEKGIVAPYDVYSPRADGDIREDFYERRGSFTHPLHHFTVHDWVVPGTHNAEWRVQIFWPINLPFLVLYVDPDYRYILFGESNRSLGWIYARSPTMDDATYHAILERFRGLGYDPSQFRRFPQFPAQVGLPDFWSDGVSG